jgi:hypothetical protein
LLNVADYARAAAAKLPKSVLDYFEGAARVNSRTQFNFRARTHHLIAT